MIFRRTVVIALISSICISGPVLAEEKKASFVSGFRNMCVDVQTKAGKSAEDIAKICNCQAEVADANYSTLKLIGFIQIGLYDKKMVTEQERIDIRKKLSACSNLGERVTSQ